MTANAIQIQFLNALEVTPKVIHVEPKISATSLNGIGKTPGGIVQIVRDVDLKIAPGMFYVLSADPVSSIRQK